MTVLKPSLSPAGLLTTLCLHASLLFRLTRFELAARYQGSWLGLFWALLLPAAMLALYTIVFGEIFSIRWPSSKAGGGATAEFAAILFAGMIVFSFFSESVLRGAQSVTSQPNYVKKLIFPLELLPLVSVLVAAAQALLSVAVLIVFHALFGGGVSSGVVWVIPVLLPVLLTSCGLAWFFSSLNVYVRDVTQILGPVMMGLMFISPIFFPISQVPVSWRAWFELNPLCLPIEQLRQALVLNLTIDWAATCRATGVSALVCWLGYAWFQKTRTGFADVL